MGTRRSRARSRRAAGGADGNARKGIGIPYPLAGLFPFFSFSFSSSLPLFPCVCFSLTSFSATRGFHGRDCLIYLRVTLMIPTSLPLDYSPLYLHLGSIHIHAGCCSKLTEDHYNSSYRMSRLLLCLYVYALDFPRFGFSVSISVLLSSPSSPSFPSYAPKSFFLR